MDLTRRALIRRASAISGALLGIRAAAPDLVFAGQDGEAVFGVRLPRFHRAGNQWQSPPIVAPRPFELLGIEAPGAGARIEIRALGEQGRWSDWLAAHAPHGHAPERALTDPVWTGPARTFEVRANRPLRGARVVLVNGGAPATASAATRFVDAGLPAGPGQPQILSRANWATSACRPRVPAVFGAID